MALHKDKMILIPANFKCCMIKQDTEWLVHNIYGEIITCIMIKKKIIGIRKVKKVSQKTIPNAKKEQNLDLKMAHYTRLVERKC